MFKSLSNWQNQAQTKLAQSLDEYAESHQNPTNKTLHHICVPVIAFTLVAELATLPYMIGPVPVGLALLFLMSLWYLSLGWRPFLYIAVETSVFAASAVVWANKSGEIWPVLLALFGLAWVGQFIGHHIEGKRPSFLTDLRFLLIGPLWVGRSLVDPVREAKS